VSAQREFLFGAGNSGGPILFSGKTDAFCRNLVSDEGTILSGPHTGANILVSENNIIGTGARHVRWTRPHRRSGNRGRFRAHAIYVKPNKQNEGLLAFSFSHYIYPRFILNKVRACILSLARLLPRATGYATGPDVDRAVDLCLPRYVWLIV
jgi:hypothetical protein